MKKFFCLLAILSLVACNFNTSEVKTYAGKALGTTYHIKFFSKEGFPVKKGIDSVFEAVNISMSNYQDNSDISKLNAGDTTIRVDHMFRDVFLLSKNIYKKTDGFFDPTVGNLVNAYGFGAQKEKLKMDSTTIDSLMNYVGFDMVSITKDNKIIKAKPGIYIDFNAIGKGYAVDRLGIYLESHGVENYLIEVGGECRAKGKNIHSEKTWRVGIDDPKEKKGERQITGILELKNKGLATSGNYRKFRYDSISGQKYVHTIDPKSGFVQKRNILSATVIAEDCATADAYATAFMAMGLKKAEAISKKLNGVDVYFVYNADGKMKTYASEGFKKIKINRDKK